MGMFKAEPIGAIVIDSPHPPSVVLENLRVRGKEWRASAIPEDLRKLKVGALHVEIDGSEFKIRWGPANPLYNPMCFGTVQPYGEGSRIRGGFKLSLRDATPLALFGVATLLPLLLDWSIAHWAFFGFAIFMAAFVGLRYRSVEPMRSRLVDVLSEAAKTPAPQRAWASTSGG
jgi:hypothetical protein